MRTCRDCIWWNPDADDDALFCDQHEEGSVRRFWLEHLLEPEKPVDAIDCPWFELSEEES